MERKEYISVQKLRALRGEVQAILAQIDSVLASPELSLAMTFDPNAVETIEDVKPRDTETLAMPFVVESNAPPKLRVGTKPGDASYADLVHRFVNSQRFTLREALDTIVPMLEKPSKRTKDIMRQSLYRDKRFAHETGSDGRVWFWRVKANAA